MFFSDDFQSKDPPKSSEVAGAATRGERVVLEKFIGTRWAGGWPLRWCSHTSCNGKWIPDDTCSNPVACNSQFALRKLLPHPSGFGPIPYTWDQTRFPAPVTGWPSVSRVVAQHAPRAFDVRC